MIIAIQVTGDKEVIKRIEKMGQSFLKFPGEMRDIGELVKNYSANQAFASQGGVFGERWVRLSNRYAVWKAKHYPGRGPLMRTGNMSKKYKYDAHDTSVKITNGAEYFEYHQTGTRHMPQRLSLAINGVQKRGIINIINAGVRKKIDEAF